VNLLIVDDHAANLKLLRAQLEAKGHAVFEAHDGVEALALLERERVEAVISDILMPRMDGHRLCEEIRRHARLRDLPIIIYTSSFTSPGDAKLALDVGADKYLTKPASVETLVAALHEAIAILPGARQPKALQEVEVLKEYSEQLVSKLEEKNTELMAAEVKFRALVAQSIVGIYIVQDDQFVYVNPGMQKIFGWSEAEMTSRTFSDFIVPEDQALAREHISKRISGAVSSVHYDMRVLHQSGAVLKVEVHGSRTEYNGRPAVMGMLLDITERKKAEEAAQRSQKRLRDLIDGLGPSMFVGLMTLEGILIEANRPALAAAGLKPEDVLGKPFEETYWWAYSQEVQQQLREAIARAVRGEASRYDVQLRAADNHLIDVDFSVQPLWGETGEVVFLVPSANVITERKRAEESLRLQGDALNAAANAIVITDRSGAIEWVNDAFSVLTGYPAVDVLGENSRLLKSGKHDPAFYQSLWDTILSGRTWRAETTNRRKDGSLYIVDMTITPVKSARGEIAHFIAIHQDLTERKQLEAQFLQAQKMESVGRLAGGVAHDFNNLLSVILGWTEMAMADLPAEHPIRPSLEEVLSAGHGAARLTKQLLAFSRQQLVEPTVFNVNDLVVGMQEMLRPLIGEDIEFVTRPGPDLATVKMDRGQVEQVLMNLVVNARDAMPTGGTLTIETANVVLDAAYLRTHADVMPGDYVMLAVSDSGAGMNEEVKTHLFEPFFTTKERGKGTGLGLATCYGIVKQAGGHIAVDSEKGVGTTMKVYLPRRREAAESAVRGHKTMPVHGVETILLVEDEPAVRRVTTRMLEAQGYRVLSTSSGAEALRVIEEEREPLQLLLTDVVLGGGMSGRVLADRVHALRPELKVLFASGYTSDVTILHGLLEQSVALVQKPFTAESLGEKVRRVLDAG